MVTAMSSAYATVEAEVREQMRRRGLALPSGRKRMFCRNAQPVPRGRCQAGSRHFKFHQAWDSLG